ILGLGHGDSFLEFSHFKFRSPWPILSIFGLVDQVLHLNCKSGSFKKTKMAAEIVINNFDGH
ncbi:hypothetical protein ACWN84_09540, partial [Pediococcus ethanolidurans]